MYKDLIWNTHYIKSFTEEYLYSIEVGSNSKQNVRSVDYHMQTS